MIMTLLHIEILKQIIALNKNDKLYHLTMIKYDSNI